MLYNVHTIIVSITVLACMILSVLVLLCSKYSCAVFMWLLSLFSINSESDALS